MADIVSVVVVIDRDMSLIYDVIKCIDKSMSLSCNMIDDNDRYLSLAMVDDMAIIIDRRTLLKWSFACVHVGAWLIPTGTLAHYGSSCDVPPWM